jgi:hypothetical protein
MKLGRSMRRVVRVTTGVVKYADALSGLLRTLNYPHVSASSHQIRRQRVTHLVENLVETLHQSEQNAHDHAEEHRTTPLGQRRAGDQDKEEGCEECSEDGGDHEVDV